MKTWLTLYRLTMLSALIGILVFSCSKGGDSPAPNPCSGVSISVTGTTTDSDPGSNNGGIAANASGGSAPFTYNVDGGAFQSSGSFNNLAKGNHTVVAKDNNGCQGSKVFTINEKSACAGVTITVSGAPTASDPCSPNGMITATAAGSTNFTYSLNGGAFQASNIFNNVAAGNYTLTAKDGAGCSSNASVSVASAPAGPLFTAVRAIVQANCAVTGCHVNPAPTGGINFAVDCNIVINKDRIKVRAVDGAGTANQMPPPPNAALSQADRDKITNWITGGGRFTD